MSFLRLIRLNEFWVKEIGCLEVGHAWMTCQSPQSDSKYPETGYSVSGVHDSNTSKSCW